MVLGRFLPSQGYGLFVDRVEFKEKRGEMKAESRGDRSLVE